MKKKNAATLIILVALASLTFGIWYVFMKTSLRLGPEEQTLEQEFLDFNQAIVDGNENKFESYVDDLVTFRSPREMTDYSKVDLLNQVFDRDYVLLSIETLNRKINVEGKSATISVDQIEKFKFSDSTVGENRCNYTYFFNRTPNGWKIYRIDQEKPGR